MIQKLFSIYFTPDEKNSLSIEIGKHHIACCCTGDQQSLQAFEYFNFYDVDEHEAFENIFKEARLHSVLLNNHFATTQVIWETAQFTCVPNSLFVPDAVEQYVSALENDAFNKALACRQEEYTVAFPVKQDALQLVAQYFPQASSSHKICQLSKDLKNDAPSAVRVVFYHHHFILIAIKNSTLQLATTFTYQSPKDCLYHILNTMQQLQLPLDETIVSVSGFIDINSALYKDLYQYIPLLQTAGRGMLKNEYPAHYFTPFYT